MKELQERKDQLDREIKLLEEGFSRKTTGVKEKLQIFTDPVGIVKKYPFKSVAYAAGSGLVIGLLKPHRRRKRGRNNLSESEISKRSQGITSVLLNELRNLAVKKAVLYLSDLIDQQLAEYKGKE